MRDLSIARGVIAKVLSFFSDLKWSQVKTRKEIDELWCVWVKRYNLMVETLIGTRPAKAVSWGRKFDIEVRRLCKEASIARCWFLEAKRAGGERKQFFSRWRKLRSAYIESWERSEKEWNIQSLERALRLGDVQVWRLLNGNRATTTRQMLRGNGSVLIDDKSIEA